MTSTKVAPEGGDDLAAIARGGRTNFFGFVLRLAARLPFLFIAGRIYGAEALGRFAYAVLIVEFAAQLATLGLKRGLAQQLSQTDQPHECVVWDAMLVALTASAIATVILAMFPHAMFPNSNIHGVEWLLPLVVAAVALTEVALAALAYRRNVRATVVSRAIVEPWTLSFAALILSFLSSRDGLIIAYVVSMAASLFAALIPLLKSYGFPRGWRPRPGALWKMARRNTPLAGADAIEWSTRRIDIAILGLFFSPAVVGVYYVAQQVASLPQKLKTSFDPILSPVITQKLAIGDKAAVARQVRQVGFWIIGAQAGVALALGIPGDAVMGLVGPAFLGGTVALAFLLAAEVVAATAAVAEGALVFTARHRNLMISTAMIALQGAMTVGLILLARDLGWSEEWQTGMPAAALMLSLGLSSILKARLLSRLLGAPVQSWRWPLIWAALAAMAVGHLILLLPRWLEFIELIVGIPAILLTFGWVLWRWGFTAEDRALFKTKKGEEPTLPPPGTSEPL